MSFYKRVLCCILAMLIVCPLAFAASGNLGISVEDLVTGMDDMLAPFKAIGMPCYPLEYSEKDLTAKTVLKLLTKHTSMSISHEDGVVKSFKVFSDEDNGEDSDNRTNEIMTTCVCAMLLTSDAINEDNAVSILTDIVTDRQPHVYGNVSYRYVTGQPFTSVVALEVMPVSE